VNEEIMAYWGAVAPKEKKVTVKQVIVCPIDLLIVEQ
jgi:hypothetical protein